MAVARSLLSSLGYQQITSLSAATGLTPPTGTVLAVIMAETQAVRWRDDGSNPTASVGMVLAPATSTNLQGMEYDGNFAAIKFIEVTASAKLNITYFG